MSDGDEAHLVPDDDDFHDPGDDVWHAEGSWQCFFVPERGIDGWLYHIVHQNVGVASGGCWVWDRSAFRHDEVLYYANFSGLPLAAVQRTLDELERQQLVAYRDDGSAA